MWLSVVDLHVIEGSRAVMARVNLNFNLPPRSTLPRTENNTEFWKMKIKCSILRD